MSTSPPPIPQQNPLLDEIHAHVASMSPGAQNAIKSALPMTGVSHPPDDGNVRSTSPITDPQSHAQVPPIGQQTAPPANPDPQSSLRPGGTSPPMLMMPPDHTQVNAPPPRGTIPGEENETSRLLSTGSGISQIKNPVGRGLAEFANDVGHTVVPGLMRDVPGTEEHHEQLLGRASGGAKLLQGQRAEDTTNSFKQAQTENEESKPALAEAKNQLGEEKLQETENNHQAQVEQHLRGQGYKTNPETGAIEPLKYEEMSPQQQAVTDLRGAQEETQQATAALKKAQKDNIPQQIAMAQQRVATARQNAATASQRLGLSQERQDFQEEKFYNPQPTQTERNKGDLAQSANHQIGVMRDVLKHIPQEFGPGGGRENQFGQWIGSSDPQAVKYRAASQYLADHSAALFGGRGQYIMQQLHDLTSERFNPQALESVLSEAESTAQGFQNAGTVHGKGGKSGYGVNPGTSGGTQTFHVGDKIYNIPADKVAAFKKDFPDAK